MIPKNSSACHALLTLATSGPRPRRTAILSSFFRVLKMSLHFGPIFGSFCSGRPTAIFPPFCTVKWSKTGRRTVRPRPQRILQPFIFILHCKMEKKWAVICAARTGAPGAAHFFFILQCKVVTKVAAERFAQGREGSCSHFFSMLHCKMEKKWAVIFAARKGAPGAAHFFSILQCKVVTKVAAERFAQGREGSCSHFFSVKWRKNGP